MIYYFDNITLNTGSHQLLVHNKAVHIEPLAFSLIAFLIEHRERYVSRDELFEALWPKQIVTDGSLSNEIKNVRKILGDDGKTQRYVKTIHGRGYQFVGNVTANDTIRSVTANSEAAKAEVAKDDESQILTDQQLAEMDPAENIYSSLPSSNSGFIGRSEELASVKAMLQAQINSAPKNPLLSIVGPGGVGKTRFAIELANQLRDHYPDGIYYLSLIPANDPATLLKALALWVNSPTQLLSENLTDSEKAIRLGQFIQSRKLLLVFDNFEHLINAAPLVSNLMVAGAQFQVVVTSRERLSISNESTFLLKGLKYLKFDRLNEVDVIQAEAYKLFLQRADQAGYQAGTDSQATEIINQIISKLEGSPLGIELAASWLRIFSLDELATEITKSLLWLETDFKDMPQRHRATRALFESTWERLQTTPNQPSTNHSSLQSAFMQLSLFIGGFSREAAETVCNITLPNLALLERNCLITKIADGRFGIHELLRQFGVEKIAESHMYITSMNKYVTYMLDYAEANSHITEGMYKIEQIEALRLETANLENSFIYLVENKRFEDAAKIVAFLWGIAASPLQMYPLFNQYYVVLSDNLDNHNRRKMTSLYLELYRQLNRYDDQYLKICEDLLEITDSSPEAGAHGAIDYYLSDYYEYSTECNSMDSKEQAAKAKSYANSAFNKLSVVVNSKVSKSKKCGKFANICGYTSKRLNNAENCKNYFLIALQESQKVKYKQAITNGHWGVVLGYCMVKDTQQALKHLISVLQLTLEFKDIRSYAQALSGFAKIAELENDFVTAVQLYGRSQALIERLTRQSVPIDTIIDEETLAVLKQKLSETDFNRSWASDRPESFQQVVRNVDTLVEHYKATFAERDPLPEPIQSYSNVTQLHAGEKI